MDVISYINAGATVTVAFFACVELFRVYRREHYESQAALARITIALETLTRTVRGWRLLFP